MFKVQIAEGVNTKTFAQAVAEGQVKFYRVRENGTTRHVPVLSGTDLVLAQTIRDERAEGKSVREISEENHLSVASTRRFLTELALTEAVTSLNRSGVIRVMKAREL
jgi:hypothetical protein